MNSETELKQLVKEKYAAIAGQTREQNAASCCGATACCGDDEVFHLMADDYSRVEGHLPDADLGLGCGLPTEFAHIREGDTVIDLGSGAGNDAFVARRLTGAGGKVIGIDFTEQMIGRARENAEKAGYNNVEFRLGDIDNMPLRSATADVVVSNCVLNLVPDKPKVFREIYRVLKPGAHFSISDIVTEGSLPPEWKKVAELYAGCVSGAIEMNAYLDIIRQAGFTAVLVQKSKPVTIPAGILEQYLPAGEAEDFARGDAKIVSMTVYAEKPVDGPGNCCEPGSGCC